MSPHLSYELRGLIAEVAELLALADPSSTPGAVFEGLRVAHEALVGAQTAADRHSPHQVDL